MRVIVSGATGLIGSALTDALIARHDEVVALTRSAKSGSSQRLEGKGVRVREWSMSERSEPWWEGMESADAVVNLAGESVAGGRWSGRRKAAIRDSRLNATRTLVRAVAAAKHRPRVFFSTSAIGYYGLHGDEELSETSAPGSDFLASVCREWEATAHEVDSSGVRLVIGRIGVVLAPNGGALQAMVLPFRFFAGGPAGDGKQWISWIHIDDVVGLILAALDRDEFRGPMNLTAPEPVRNSQLSREIGVALHRPSWLPAPRFALKAALGEMADIVVGGQRVFPAVAMRLGYRFAHTRSEEAVRAALTPTGS